MVLIPKPAGGRGSRRRGGAVSLTSLDVPTVRSAPDPGVRVPAQDDFGAGLKNFGNALSEGADTALRIVQRNEGLARDADDTLFATKLSEENRGLQEEGGLADEEKIKQSIERVRQEQELILSEHKGGEISRDMLRNRLERRFLGFSDSLAAQNIVAADARMRGTMENRVKAITQDVLGNPDVLISEDPLAAWYKHNDQLDSEIDFLELRPDQAAQMRKTGQAEIAMTMIGSMLLGDQTERAKAFLRSEEIRGVLPSNVQRNAAQRIVNFEQAREKARQANSADLDKARIILGPDATEEQVRDTALKIAGVEKNNDYQFFKAGENTVLVLNKKTGGIVQRIEGESVEQQARREAEVERAKLTARAEVINGVLQSVGLGPLFGTTPPSAPAPRPTAGAQPTAGGAKQPTRPDEALPDEAGQTIVGSAGSIVEIFGPKEPVSEDAQSVARLFVASRALMLMGQTAFANSLISQARYIAENSSEIRRERELDKPISAELAAELGVALGTPLRAVLGVIPRSPEEKARAKAGATPLPLETARDLRVPFGTTLDEAAGRVPMSGPEKKRREAIAGARGREQVKAEEQITYLQEARIQITDLLTELEDDPRLVGGVGGLRATGRSAITLLEDFGFDSVVNTAREIASNESDLSMTEIRSYFDSPTLSSLDIIENSVGLIIARVRTPAGRIPVELIKLSIKDVGLKGARGSEVIRDRLQYVRDNLIDERLRSLKRRFPEVDIPELQQGGAFDRTKPTAPEGVTRWRVEGNKVVPVPQPGTEVPGGTPEQRSDALAPQALDEARLTAETTYPYLKKFRNIQVAPATVEQKGGLGEFYGPDDPGNPSPGTFTIGVGPQSAEQPSGVAGTIIADMVHAAAEMDPEMQSLITELEETISDEEIALARRRYEEDFRGKFSGTNFESFENFLRGYWLEGMVQHLLLPDNSEIDQIRAANPEAGPTLDRIKALFETEPDTAAPEGDPTLQDLETQQGAPEVAPQQRPFSGRKTGRRKRARRKK